ncbi:MAG: ImmA/IrrE family metallo-endopeptidase [Bacteroidaceae bacterium]|nr:ImmA/IrrE family metallo-endopeptidase [Bacteroidaceae bacterium]
MNTTKKGTEFEGKVYDYVADLLNTDGFLGATKPYSKIFKHKKYKCIGTNRKIDFDITIETYNPDVEDGEWSSLIVLECKNYRGTVDIADLDEFESKLNNVSHSGIKGVMITSKGFSANGIEQAKRHHIALAVFSECEKKWLVARCKRYNPEYYKQMLMGYSPIGSTPVIYSDGYYFNMIDYLKSAGASISEKHIVSIPYLTEEAIEAKANEIYRNLILGINNIAGEVLTKMYPDVRIRFDKIPADLLGTFSFDDRVITVSIEIINDLHRRNFTLAHEVGHLYLHEPVLKDHADGFDDYSIDSLNLIQNETVRRMEIQANIFAAYLLVPRNRLIMEVKKIFEKLNIRSGRFYLDNQLCNIKECDIGLTSLSNTFHVSKEVIRYRLINEHLMVDAQKNPQRVGCFLNF